MRTDLLIVGSGLTGLFAANLAAEQGMQVTIASRGRGGLSGSHGCIDLHGSANPSRTLTTMPATHPHSSIPRQTLRDSFSSFKRLCNEGGLEYHGGISSSIMLLSAYGIPYRTSLIPTSMIKGRLDDPRPLAIAGLANFRDFWPHQIATNAKRSGVNISATLELPTLPLGTEHSLNSADLSHRMEDQNRRRELWRSWKPKLSGQKRVGIPAILGLRDAPERLAEAEEELGVELFEIPTLPPCLPGLRLELLLRERALAYGVRFTEGKSAIGRIDGRSQGKLAAGVQLGSGGGAHALDGRFVLLATGGFLHGGLVAKQNGIVTESVFTIPVTANSSPDEWSAATPWEAQTYAYFGLSTDAQLRPLDSNGRPFLLNLFAAGGILAGADRSRERSRQGIDLASAAHAINSILSST